MIVNKHIAAKIIFLSALMFTTTIFVHDALADGCCLPGYTAKATYSDPKQGTLGVMTDLKIFNGVCVDITGVTYCVEWAACSFDHPLLLLHQVGGDDTDVCVGHGEALPYDVSEIRTWPISEGGSQDPNNPGDFKFYPPEPSYQYPCTEYGILAMADDTGPCNVGNEQRTASATIKVWKQLSFTAIDTFDIEVSISGPIPYTITFRCDVGDDYYNSNGRFDGNCQTLSVQYICDYQHVWGIASAIHAYYVVPQQKSQVGMAHYGACCPYPDDDTKKHSCSYDNKAYAYEFIQANGGVKSEFYVEIYYITDGNYHKSGTETLTIFTSRCCE